MRNLDKWGNFVPSLLIAILNNLYKWGSEDLQFSEVIITIENYLYNLGIQAFLALNDEFCPNFYFKLQYKGNQNLDYSTNVMKKIILLFS